MKIQSKDQLLLENAYLQVREGMLDKAKEFVNKNVYEFDPNAPGGGAHEQEKGAAPYKDYIAAVVALMSDGKHQPPNPHSNVEKNKYAGMYLKYVLECSERELKQVAPPNLRELLFHGGDTNNLPNLQSPLAVALTAAYDRTKMSQASQEAPQASSEDPASKHAAMASQQQFAAQRRQATGQ